MRWPWWCFVFFNSHVQYICIVGIRQSRNLPLRVREYWEKWSICRTCDCFMSIYGDKTQEDLPLNQHVDLTTRIVSCVNSPSLVHWVGFLVKACACMAMFTSWLAHCKIFPGFVVVCLITSFAWVGTIPICFPNHHPAFFLAKLSHSYPKKLWIFMLL